MLALHLSDFSLRVASKTMAPLVHRWAGFFAMRLGERHSESSVTTGPTVGINLRRSDERQLWGHQRTCWPLNRTSVLPPKADSSRTSGHVRFVPKQEVERFYSKTSSARASSCGGTSIPSDFAVLRLMTSRYVEGCSIGRSAGLAPLRIRLT
jgi:hypothetical protein